MATTLTGANSFLLKAELKRRTNAFVSEFSDMALERYDGEAITPEKVAEIIQALPFLTAKRMVVLRNVSRNKLVAEKLLEVMGDIPESTELILVEDSPDKRTSFYKNLQKNTDLLEFKELDELGLAQWAQQLAKDNNGQLNREDALYLVRRVGVNQLLVASEVRKLLSYDPIISRQTIDLLTEPTPQSSVFDLLDAAMSGNNQKTVALYQEQRQQKVEPMAIMGMFAWQLHILALVKAAGSRSAGEIASQAKVSPYVVGKTQRLAQHSSLTQIKQWIHRAAQLDVRLKRQSIDGDEAMMTFLTSLH